ncbi:unnamed protein product [Rotaria socialis]|uniref:Uncharacterized protein n=2 Tax=Rotaria socialis TaxID=392032 RepID=A0A817Q974_9BILA|nr:unnamed protein product [Rotaria socialis]CAF3409542.1 unnamed protein product [Rotaria socialis]CAF3572443.1 unnamed protein product [Rotaria socialis]CAF3663143.1 unnamed protein product [Rotaria socialis]
MKPKDSSIHTRDSIKYSTDKTEDKIHKFMTKQISLDDVRGLRVVNDKPIRLLFLAEATSNVGVIVFVFLYPSLFLSIFLQPQNEITPLASFLIFLWNSWIIVITGLMYAAVPSRYNTPTLTAGIVHVRRFIYWALLSSEILLAVLLICTVHRTTLSVGFANFILFVAMGRVFVLFPKKAWFGTVVFESMAEKEK